MTIGAWHAQPFPPQGASAAEGIRNQLGRPELDLLTILVREAAQNSWDARIGDRSVDFRIELKDVGPAHAPAWRDMLQRGIPSQEHLPLRDLLKAATIRTLTVSDRGTTGLGGPTRADSAVVRGHDFVSFVRNVGEPRDTEMGGGTYGFGKGIFYLLSSAGTVLIHTRCRTEAGTETRLIGCALWKSFVVGTGLAGTRYTGRHWWGKLSDDVVEPLTGAEADRVAQQLGLQPFASDETGTTVVVVDPVLGEADTPEEAANYLAESITWNLWPKMLTNDAKPIPDMRFSIRCNGLELPVPDPRQTRPLDLFVAAYEASWSDTDSETLWCKSPMKKLGKLGLEKRFMPPIEPTRAGSAAGIEGTVHHVCLMRATELVVTYQECPKPPAEHVSYAGVFRADEAMDSLYAQSEPPTHDAWRWHSLEGRDRTYVRTTFRRLKDATESLIEVSHTTKSASADVPLGAASRVFSSLVAGAWGNGGATAFVSPRASIPPAKTDAPPIGTPGEDLSSSHSGDLFAPDIEMPAPSSHSFEIAEVGSSAGGAPRGRGPRRARVEFVGDPYLDMRADRLVLIQEFRVVGPGFHLVTSELAVSLPGAGRESDPPRNALQPEFFAWEDEQGILHRDPYTAIDGARVWKAVVVPAPDTVTEISLTALIAETVR